MYLINGDKEYYQLLGHYSEDEFFDRICLAKYDLSEWTSSYGEKIWDHQKAIKVQSDLKQIISILVNIYKTFGEFNTNPANNIRHVYPAPQQHLLAPSTRSRFMQW